MFFMNEPHFRGKVFATVPRHCLLLKASCFMTMSPWKVFLLTEAIFLFVSLFKEQLTSISNYFPTFCANQVY